MHPIWGLVSVLTAWTIYTRAARAPRALYLTFDDGPNPRYTPGVLDLLDRHRARATFFLTGGAIEAHGDIVKEIVARGHALGNHSYSHPAFTGISLRRQVAEIERTNDLLRRFDGRPRHVFRPPYGKIRLPTIALCLLRRQSVALWTHDSLDFKLGAPALVERLAGLSLRPGDILLFHDDQPASPTALDELLPRWRGAGFEFATL
jgi:peptidoglycan/xylan/chitin deacetylase (PgdA/CDA1 family)